VEGAPNYGGIMLWSRSYDKDTGFSVKLQGILQNRTSDKKRRICMWSLFVKDDSFDSSVSCRFNFNSLLSVQI
jgi:hypothetical protein